MLLLDFPYLLFGESHFVVRYAYITVYHVRLSVIFQMRTLVAIYVIGFVAALHYIICLIINTQR